MALGELTDPEAVKAAMAEFKQLGRQAFLEKYGFGPARDFFVSGPDGAIYDSKAIAGVAHGFQFPDRGPLRSGDFSGGEATVKAKLESLGFRVEKLPEGSSDLRSSESEIWENRGSPRV